MTPATSWEAATEAATSGVIAPAMGGSGENRSACHLHLVAHELLLNWNETVSVSLENVTSVSAEGSLVPTQLPVMLLRSDQSITPERPQTARRSS